MKEKLPPCIARTASVVWLSVRLLEFITKMLKAETTVIKDRKSVRGRKDSILLKSQVSYHLQYKRHATANSLTGNPFDALAHLETCLNEEGFLKVICGTCTSYNSQEYKI